MTRLDSTHLQDVGVQGPQRLTPSPHHDPVQGIPQHNQLCGVASGDHHLRHIGVKSSARRFLRQFGTVVMEGQQVSEMLHLDPVRRSASVDLHSLQADGEKPLWYSRRYHGEGRLQLEALLHSRPY